MPRIRTKPLLDKLEADDYTGITLRILGGTTRYCVLIDDGRETLIHENQEGQVKEYPTLDHAFEWLKNIVDMDKVVVDSEFNKRH